MDLETYAAAINLACGRGDYVTLGGGEPTVNKHFIEMLEFASEKYRRGMLELPPCVITNGKLHGKVNKVLDRLAQECDVGCRNPLYVQMELSQDPWHDPINHDLVWRFQCLKSTKFEDRNVMVGIRTVNGLGAWGRAADPARGLPISKYQGECCCDDLTIDPKGDIWSCACKKDKLGNVADSNLDLSWWDRDHAHTGGVELENNY